MNSVLHNVCVTDLSPTLDISLYIQVVHCMADLRAAMVYDHETTPVLSVDLTAEDRRGLSTSIQFTLTVQDTNDPPTVKLQPLNTAVTLISLITFSIVIFQH